MSAQQPKRLGEVLVESGVITERQLQEALARKRDTHRRLGSTLVSMGLATEGQICRAVAEQLGIPVVNVSALTPEVDALQRVPAEIAIKHCLVPLKFENGRLLLAMADPLDTDGFDAAWRAARSATVDRVMAPESEIMALIQEAYGSAGGARESLMELGAKENVTILSPDVTGRIGADTANLNAADTINSVLGGAAEMGATHVRIESAGRTTVIRYRIDGRLRKAATLPGAVHNALIGRLRSLFHVDPSQPASQQEGHASLQLGQHQFGLRVSLLPSIHGDAAVVRILDPRRSQMRVEDLGFSEQDLAMVQDLLALPHGMILVAGPEESGLSTTLAAFLNRVEDETLSLVSVEDPVEWVFPGITQVEVNDRAGMTWVDAMQAALRLEPDVLMVSELRDPGAVAIALRAAMEGRLVIAGLRAEGAIGAIALLRDMSREPYLVAVALKGAIGQRLVRRTCQGCQVVVEPDPGIISRFGLSPADVKGQRFVHGNGCSKCGATGFIGRTGIFEVVQVDQALQECFSKPASLADISKVVKANGMRSLREDALAKVYAGITSLEEVARLVP